MTAWIALIIAAGSLSWNVISTLLSWHKADVHVMLSIREFSSISLDDIGHIMWFQITAMNKGGSAVAVTNIGVELDNGNKWSPVTSPTHPFKSVAIVGPDFPVTIEVNHLASWHLDVAWVVGTGLRKPRPVIRPYVELSDGSIIKTDHVIGEWARADALEIFEQRREHHKNDPPPALLRFPHHCPECELRQQDENLSSCNESNEQDSTRQVRPSFSVFRHGLRRAPSRHHRPG